MRAQGIFVPAMTRHERNTLAVLILLLAIGFLFFFVFHRSAVPLPDVPHPDAQSTTTVKSFPAQAPEPTAPIPVTPKASEKSGLIPAPKASAPKGPVTASGTGVPAPPKLELHKELIPKDITIVRCYYDQDIVPPGTTIGFDINGSGFTSEFQKMIKVESGVPGVTVHNLVLKTANQIHGELRAAPDAKTGFVYPRVLIKNLPVFSAPDPFAVVRKGEVLTILFISMEDNGRAGRFRVITHLDEQLAQTFRVDPSTPQLEISDIQARLPYAMEGTLRIGQRMPPGDYGLIISIDNKQVFRRDGMIKIVRPNVGMTGFVQNVMASEPYHRPGEALQLYVQGTGMSADDLSVLEAKVDGFDMGVGSFTYISGVQMRLTFTIPANAPIGTYGVTIAGADKQALVSKKDVFKIVAPNWIGGVRLDPVVGPGGKTTLRIIGKELTADYIQDLKIETDEPGITIETPVLVNATQATAVISFASTIAPGDYWLHLSARGQKIAPPFGSIVKVQSR